MILVNTSLPTARKIYSQMTSMGLKLLLVGVLTFVTFSLSAQEIFNGLVGDSASFVALPFVNIQVKGKRIGTTTDINGSFRIEASRNDTLIFSSVGYKTLEYPLIEWEPGMILMAEQFTLLEDVTITERRQDPYAGLFDEENEALRRANKKLPFYYSRGKKQKIKIGRLENENIRVQTYVNVIIKNETVRKNLTAKYKLTDEEYYKLLGDFNSKNYSVMYYLTAPELLSLLNNFFASNAPLK
jgi:hypothetical protein